MARRNVEGPSSTSTLDVHAIAPPLRQRLIYRAFDGLPLGGELELLGDGDPLPLLAELEARCAGAFEMHAIGPPPGRSEGGPAPSGGSERSERGGTRCPPPGRSEGGPTPAEGASSPHTWRLRLRKLGRCAISEQP